MRVLVIDYRGDDTVINSRGDSLFHYRTHYFQRQQQDFHLWRQWGHTFHCFTQHGTHCEGFDEVIPSPRAPVARAKNWALDWIQSQGITDPWIGLWDNDSTLYWDRLRSREVPQHLDHICGLAQSQHIFAWVPFNAQQAPYQPVSHTEWQFKPTIQMKGSMTFLRNPCHYAQQRFREDVTTMDDLVWAIEHTLAGRRVGTLQQASLNELVCGKSTIFKVNAYHQQYKKPGPGANPKGLLQWDAQLDRREKYQIAHQEIQQIYGATWQELQGKQRALWNDNLFDKFFSD